MKHLPTCEEPFQDGQLCHVCGLRTEVEGMRACSRIVARSPAMRELLRKVGPVARSDAPVVIQGESGTGKEVLARSLHANSPRAPHPFVAVNVAALPTELLESELFGHAKGAFTGATSAKRGLFEEASGGTIFLDEIGEMPHALQAKLLRALQDGEVRKVGETRTFSVDVRVVCATNADLERAIREGRFRPDLYYRLRVFRFVVPPLRHRQSDILPLARVLAERVDGRSRRFTPAADKAMVDYAWPGNVRELANAVHHGVVLSQGADIDAVHLPEELLQPAQPVAVDVDETLAAVERRHVLRVLQACGGNQVEAAQRLGIGRTTLWRKLREISGGSAGTDPASFDAHVEA